MSDKAQAVGSQWLEYRRLAPCRSLDYAIWLVGIRLQRLKVARTIQIRLDERLSQQDTRPGTLGTISLLRRATRRSRNLPARLARATRG